MQKLRYESILRNLKKEGLRFTSFTVETSGEYAAEDADWNYKDIPHLHYIHAQAEAYPVVIGDDVLCNVNMQKVLGIWYPIAVVIYELEKNHLVYFTTLFFFALIIDTKISEPTPLNTTVVTTFSIGYPKWLFFTVPLLRWMMKRNHLALIKDDIPMRNQRGQLRKLGYEFRKKGDSYSFAETSNIYESNVALPAGMDPAGEAEYRTMLESQPEVTVGDAGLLGLRLVRSNDQVTIWPRTCPHEGAPLDKAPCKEGAIHCPWHGRTIHPVGSFIWGQDADIESKEFNIQVRGRKIIWQYHGAGLTRT